MIDKNPNTSVLMKNWHMLHIQYIDRRVVSYFIMQLD